MVGETKMSATKPLKKTSYTVRYDVIRNIKTEVGMKIGFLNL